MTGKEVQSDGQVLKYPETQKVDTVDLYYDTEVPDPYRWLEDDRSEQTADWVKSQNELTFSYLDQITFREKIKMRLEELYDYERVYAPTKHGEYYYFYKNDGLQKQSVLYRKKALDGEAEVFIDPNKFNEEGTVSLASTSFSKDGSLFAYLISEGGSDWRKAIVMHTDTKEQIGDTLYNIKFSGVSWRGNDGFYYSGYDKPEGSALSERNQKHMLFYHTLGTAQSMDKLIFGGEKQPRKYVGSSLTEDERFLVITSAQSSSGNDLYVQDLSEPEAPIVPLVEDFDHDHEVLTNAGSKLFIRTNMNAPNNRLVQVDFSDPIPANWVDVIPENENVLTTSVAGGKIFAKYIKDAITAVKQYDMSGKLEREITLPGLGTARGFAGRNTDKEVYYTFTSFTNPSTIYKYSIESGESLLYQQPQVDFNPDDYVTKQVFYTSKDGTQIPMFIVYKKGLEFNGKNPTYLYGYGGFNVNLLPTFSTSRIVWLENGGVYAQPNLRGGGEYGEEWHNQGTKMQKQNVFDDFVAAAEYLINHNYTSSEYLALSGGSNGGLLVGATMTQRPDLARVALPEVGVMDMLRYHKFTIGAVWASDYGTVNDSKEMFKYLMGYSPIHNVKAGVSYPATMVITADHDDRVVPAHSYKFIANLQEKNTGDNPMLIRIETDAGHSAGTPVNKIIEQTTDEYAFAWYNMGITPPLTVN